MSYVNMSSVISLKTTVDNGDQSEVRQEGKIGTVSTLVKIQSERHYKVATRTKMTVERKRTKKKRVISK